MDASDDCVAEFERACSELSVAKYILAEQKIAQLLQVIAKSKNLYALMGACMQGFDFGAELIKAKTPQGLVAPSEPKKQIAFVFCLLLSIDTKQTDFEKFLHTFYGGEDNANAEFSEFARQVILPFRKNVAGMYYAEADAPAFNPAPAQTGGQTAPPPTGSAPPLPAMRETAVTADPMTRTELDELKIRSLSDVAREIIGIVARDSSISSKNREELMLVLEAFEQAVQIGAEKAIRTMYIALKYTLKSSPLARQLEVQYDDLERLIAEYDLD
jgi:hypothetical protein